MLISYSYKITYKHQYSIPLKERTNFFKINLQMLLLYSYKINLRISPSASAKYFVNRAASAPSMTR